MPSTSAWGTSVDAGPGRVDVEVVAEARCPRLEQQRVLGQLGDRHRSVPVERVAVGHDEHEVLVEQRLGVDVGVVERQVDDGQVEAAVDELGEERGGGGVDHHDAGCGGGRRPSPGGAAARASGRWCRSRRGARGRRCGPSAEATSDAERVELGLDAPGPGDHELALLGQLAVAAVDQGRRRAPARAGRCGWRRSTARCAAPGPRPRSCGGRPRRRGRRAGGGPSLDMMAPIADNCWTDVGRTAHDERTTKTPRRAGSPAGPSSEGLGGLPPVPRPSEGAAAPGGSFRCSTGRFRRRRVTAVRLATERRRVLGARSSISTGRCCGGRAGRSSPRRCGRPGLVSGPAHPRRGRSSTGSSTWSARRCRPCCSPGRRPGWPTAGTASAVQGGRRAGRRAR